MNLHISKKGIKLLACEKNGNRFMETGNKKKRFRCNIKHWCYVVKNLWYENLKETSEFLNCDHKTVEYKIECT